MGWRIRNIFRSKKAEYTPLEPNSTANFKILGTGDLLNTTPGDCTLLFGTMAKEPTTRRVPKWIKWYQAHLIVKGCRLLELRFSPYSSRELLRQPSISTKKEVTGKRNQQQSPNKLKKASWI